MGLFTSSSRKDSEDNSDKGGDGDDYDVCEEHGHSFRDHGSSEIDSVFLSVETNWPVERGFIKDAIPGSFLGIQHLTKTETRPCRDCPKESTQNEVLETRIVFCKDGEVKSIAHAHYEQLVAEELEEDT